MLSSIYRKEINAFRIFGSDAKKLLLANLIYSIAFPFIIIFGTAFVKRVTGGNNSMALVYNYGFFIGLIIGYFINGLVLQYEVASIKKLFIVGILLSVIPLSVLMFYGVNAGYLVFFYGVFVGVGNGIYWSCRNYLSMLVTKEANRNLFFSIEQFIIVSCNAIVPLLFGSIILAENASSEYKLSAYKYTSLVIVGINIIGCLIILSSEFRSPSIARFIYFKFGSFWNKQRCLTFCVGMVESGFMVLMTLLILTVAGDESVLGKIEFFAAVLSIVIIYVVGRMSKVGQRGVIMLAGALILISGSFVLCLTINNQHILVGGLTFSFFGVIVLKISQVIADPLIHSTFRATYVSSCEKAALLEKRDSYSYIMDNEYYMNGGRVFGGLLFLYITTAVSTMVALQYTFLILAGIQLLSAFLIRLLNKYSVESR